MSQIEESSRKQDAGSVEDARTRWLEASERASRLSAQLFEPGTFGGGAIALEEIVHGAETARAEAERLFRDYHDLDRQRIESEMLELQRSQRLATWASFTVAALVGIATVAQTLLAFLK